MSKIIVSGEAHGSGSDHYRWVSRLSKGAKRAIKEGTALVICERPFNDHHGEWYVVKQTGRSRWDHRLPTSQEAQAIRDWEQS